MCIRNNLGASLEFGMDRLNLDKWIMSLFSIKIGSRNTCSLWWEH